MTWQMCSNKNHKHHLGVVQTLVVFFGGKKATGPRAGWKRGAMSIKLRELIRSIRACKTAAEERAVVARECALIRTAFKEDDNQFRRLAERGEMKGMVKGETDNSMNIVFFRWSTVGVS